jgi:hypothetical protein
VRRAEAARRIWGIRPDEIASAEEAHLEFLREQVRDSRWRRRERQFRCLAAVLAPVAGAVAVHVAGTPW